jgi:hypothetical protein
MPHIAREPFRLVGFGAHLLERPDLGNLLCVILLIGPKIVWNSDLYMTIVRCNLARCVGGFS